MVGRRHRLLVGARHPAGTHLDVHSHGIRVLEFVPEAGCMSGA